MSHIKIHKHSLDYDYYAMFHSYTMNNFVRNIMRKGKYKKALKIARLGLIGAIKRIYHSLRANSLAPMFKIPLNFRRATPTYLSQKTQENLKIGLNWHIEEEYNNTIKRIRKLKYNKQSLTVGFNQYIASLEEKKKKEIEESNKKDYQKESATCEIAL